MTQQLYIEPFSYKHFDRRVYTVEAEVKYDSLTETIQVLCLRVINEEEQEVKLSVPDKVLVREVQLMEDFVQEDI